MSKLEILATSADVGRINPLEKPLLEEIHCPLMVFGGRKIKRYNWSLYQCQIRIEEKASCVKTCLVIKQLGLT